MKTPKELLTVRDLAVDYAIPESSQRLFRQQGRFIPAYRVGRRLVFRRSDFEAWLSARAVGPRDRGDGTDAVRFTPHQIARLRELFACQAVMTSLQIERLVDELTAEPEALTTESTAEGDRS